MLTEKFTQDSLEEHLGNTRSVNRRNDNPSLYKLVYSENIVGMKRSITPVNGNTKERFHGKRLMMLLLKKGKKKTMNKILCIIDAG